CRQSLSSWSCATAARTSRHHGRPVSPGEMAAIMAQKQPIRHPITVTFEGREYRAYYIVQHRGVQVFSPWSTSRFVTLYSASAEFHARIEFHALLKAAKDRGELP